MAISILDHDRVRSLGIDLNKGWHNLPRECFDVSFAGAVLDEYERNGYDDSDFYAVVWDEAEQRVKNIEYASTRWWTYANGCTIDATEEVRAKAQAWWRTKAIEAEEARQRALYAVPYVGATVTVARGRKVPMGFTGVVLSMERRPAFRGNYREAWVLVSNETAAHKVKAEYCDVHQNQEKVEKLIADHMDAFRRSIATRETNGRSMLWVGYRDAA